MQAIHTPNAPDAIGTYSQAIRCDHLVFLSGQIPLDPQSMELCSEDIQEQIDQVFKNISEVCAAAGGSLANIVKLTVYLTDLNHFPLINESMQRYFTQPYPARAAIEVSALPRGAKVEVDGIMSLSSL